MANPIQPTVGRVVLYFPVGLEGEARAPLAAFICAVHASDCLTLAAFDGNGNHLPVAFCYHEDAKMTDGTRLAARDYWAWMTYQVGQAAKTEAVTSEAVETEVKKQVGVALADIHSALAKLSTTKP